MKPVCGLGEGALFRDRHERAQVPQIHRPTCYANCVA
jgi:hypothetical protein